MDTPHQDALVVAKLEDTIAQISETIASLRGQRTQATAKTYSAWVKANKARRKASQQAWYMRRRKQRTPEQ